MFALLLMAAVGLLSLGRQTRAAPAGESSAVAGASAAAAAGSEFAAGAMPGRSTQAGGSAQSSSTGPAASNDSEAADPRAAGTGGPDAPGGQPPIGGSTTPAEGPIEGGASPPGSPRSQPSAGTSTTALDAMGYATNLPPSPTIAIPEQLTGYVWPIRKGLITSFFAPRSNGFLIVDGQRVHEGLDVATYCGDRIRAAHDGTVLAAGRNFEGAMAYQGSVAAFEARIERRHENWALPIVVVIDDGNGYRSAYVHLERTAVKVGQHVHAGQTIGFEGMTGNASGCHLHYELFRMDGSWMPVAPEFVKKDKYPPAVRERIDPLRVLSLLDRWAPRMVPGINPPKESPGLGRPTATRQN